MDENRKLQITVWQNEPASDVRTTPGTRSRRYEVPTRALGLVGAVFVHAIVCQWLFYGTPAQVVVQNTLDLAATSIKNGAESPMTLVVVQSNDPPEPDTVFELFTSGGTSLQDLPIPLVSIDPPTASVPTDLQGDTPSPQLPMSTGDAAGRAHLFGIYSGQISARIERAWRRPRTPIDDQRVASQAAREDAPFRCQVQIIQDTSGNVQEILLPACNGSAAWQRSLVLAIQQSSPLPPPPSQTVFTNALTMTFTGYAYTPDSAPDEYEIEMPRPLANTSLPTSKAAASSP